MDILRARRCNTRACDQARIKEAMVGDFRTYTHFKRVPARERSRFLVHALEKCLREQEVELARACVAANRDPKARVLEKEWDRVQDEIEEPWIDSP